MAKFLRQDTKETELIDPVTGEIKHVIRETTGHTISRTFKEANFVKVYYDTFLAAIGENETPLTDFLIAIGKHMVIKDNMQIVHLDKFTKELIAQEIGKSLDRVNHYVVECTKLDLLYRLGSPRSGVYAVSPFIMSRSKDQDVLKLQMNYEAKRGEFTISAPDPQKQIEQLRFTGFEPQEEELERD